ncbi:Alpha/beta-hydrolase [Pleurostoma richardsiae]|uniref:Carboxylic ester hydrolase n=1 Tax=Pleurostoma richardsiae TaxID=41990 RepID=A0AA38R4Z0_9PEZI|nr:Alpha/beta-hydrolase [Pleurostoma richardsiae]
MRCSPVAQGLLGLAISLRLPLVEALYFGGGLTILSQNLLDGAQNNGSAAILVSQPSTYTAAEAACKLLGELLWDPDTEDFNASLNSSLSYQLYQGLASEDQLYWISQPSSDSSKCRSIDTNGTFHTLSCTTQLPTLCTQSAPVSNSSSSDSSAAWQVTQPVANSQFTGYRDYHAWKFRGVRYAQKPDRFAYSSAYLQSGQVSALTAGADCVQPVGEVTSGSSEDCLFLNIWTPHLPRMVDTDKKELKPVMVYFYGGGYTSGSGKNANTDGTNLASRGDVVVVSVNYRVGSVGFLAFKDGVHNGNYAVSDMVTSLEWVSKYIKYFGGDASKVTVFGESAGAGMTHILLASPKAKGLFQRAIMQSDPDGYPSGSKLVWTQYPSVEEAYETVTVKVLEEAGCLNATDPIGCLDKTSGFDLVNLTTNAHTVVADGTYVAIHELIVNSTGLASDVDVMTGTNRDEEGIDMPDYPGDDTTFEEYFGDFVHSNYGANLSDIFPDLQNISLASSASTPEQILNASIRIATGAVFSCFDQAKAASAARHGAFRSTYAFVFNRTYSPSGYTKPWCDAPKTAERPHGDPDAEYYKCHAGEQLAVFGNALRVGQPDRDGRDVPFMQLVVDYWAAFARAGDPNPDEGYLLARGHLSSLAQVEAGGRWDQVDAETPTARLLQWDGGEVPFPDRSVCDAIGVPLDVLQS